MNSRSLILFFASAMSCLLTLVASLSAQAQNDLKKRVRVRMQSQQMQVFITGTGVRVQGMDYSFKNVAIPRSSESFAITRIQKNGRGLWLVKSSQKENAQFISSEFLLLEGKNIRNNSQALPSQVLLTAQKEKIDVVGILPLEDYLIGVLASEMPLSWPLEALKAQAVAARSYALVVMKERAKKPYHLESSILDQVFKHVLTDSGDDALLIRKAATAVKATRDVELQTAKGQTLKAFYHSDCGGKTVSARDVWHDGVTVNAGQAVDESCPTNPKASWTLQVDKESLHAKVKKFLKQKKPQVVTSLEFIRAPQEERVQQIKVAFNDGGAQFISANDFRSVVGFQELKSTLFSTAENKDSYVFEGRGYGHGVGLCQWGSRALGMQGKGYQEILKHYYPLARLSPATNKDVRTY